MFAYVVSRLQRLLVVCMADTGLSAKPLRSVVKLEKVQHETEMKAIRLNYRLITPLNTSYIIKSYHRSCG